jgi:hypothetical protein
MKDMGGGGVVADGRCSITSDEFHYKAKKDRAIAVYIHICRVCIYGYF